MILKKIALVTGAAGGIGRAIVSRIANDVDVLILWDINETNLEALKQSFLKVDMKCDLIFQVCDAGEGSAVNACLDALQEIPNIVVNNAGYGGPFQLLPEVSDDMWHLIMNTNVKAVFNICRIVLPLMKSIGFGRIINIASIQGLYGAAYSSTYVAAKHAVIGYTKSIAAEWGGSGVTCNAICPGYIDTAMGPSAQEKEKKILEIPLRRLGLADEVAELVCFLSRQGYLNGAVVTIDGGKTCYV